MAVNHALQLHASGLQVVLDADMRGFFDNLPHQVILQAVRDRVADGKVLDLLERFLRCGVLEDGRLLATTKGTPQGSSVWKPSSSPPMRRSTDPSHGALPVGVALRLKQSHR
jgi:hypothetical protein